MICFAAVIERFDEKAEKSGWSYILIDAAKAGLINPGVKKGYRVKGFVDKIAIEQTAIIPMGTGNFILPINGELRKKIKKGKGDSLLVKLSLDKSELTMDADFLACLDDEPAAREYFYSLPPGHRNYFSNWIRSAKADLTKTKRIVLAVNALSIQMNFGEMIRAGKAKKI